MYEQPSSTISIREQRWSENVGCEQLLSENVGCEQFCFEKSIYKELSSANSSCKQPNSNFNLWATSLAIYVYEQPSLTVMYKQLLIKKGHTY